MATDSHSPHADARRTLGARGEQLVAEQLTDAGWRVVARNWRSPDPLVRGELDVVAVDPDGALVFVEVKTRRSATSFGGPLAAVTHTKQAKLRQLGLSYLRQDNGRVRTFRFDVVGVVLATDSGDPQLQHVRAAF